MKGKIVWLVVSCLMVLSLMLASCAQAVTEEEEEKVAPPPEEEDVVTEEEVVSEEIEMVRDALGQLVEKPKYGGVFTYSFATTPLFFDECRGFGGARAPTWSITNEDLLTGDLLKGPGGSNEFSFYHHCFPWPEFFTGLLAESWEMPDDNTFVFHIRKGVHFHDKPPANGREMNADDVVFNIKRLFWDCKTSFEYTSYGPDFLESVEAPDKWTVVAKCKPGVAGRVYELLAEFVKIYPPEAIEQYGDMEEWENACGTGPFILTDYVQGSSATFVRFDNYWMKDPFHPDNQLPYVDGVKMLFIADTSTRTAALRTGKLDHLGLAWEDSESVIQTNPELQYEEYTSCYVSAINMRVDKPELPWHDVRVRQALSMAVDQQAILDSYYGGRGELVVWPVAPVGHFSYMYTPFEELPESARLQFEYRPEEAKQLLAEAGYPDGFKTSIICHAIGATQVELLSIVKEYWADIGVDLELDVREYGAWTGLLYGHRQEQLIMGFAGGSLPFSMVETRTGQILNFSMVSDASIDEDTDFYVANYFDVPAITARMKERIPYMLELHHAMLFPAPSYFIFWQPWVKGYHGETEPGFQDVDYPRHLWIDQDLKEKMTGQR